MLSSLLAVVLAVALVQAWTLRTVNESMLQRAQAELDASLRLLQQRLAPFGTEWPGLLRRLDRMDPSYRT